MARLLSERIGNMKSEGRFTTFVSATVLSGFIVMGPIVSLVMAFDCLHFLGGTEIPIAVFAIATIISVVLAKRGFYEKARDYIATLDEKTQKTLHRRYVIILGTATSVYLVAAVILLIKNLYVFD